MKKFISTLAIFFLGCGFVLLTSGDISMASAHSLDDQTVPVRCTCRNGQCVADGAGGAKCNTSGDCSANDNNCYQDPKPPTQ